MTRVTTAVIATVVAMPLFSGVSFAEGDYYEGASKQKTEAAISHDSTGSVPSFQAAQGDEAKIDSGDYYEGATRPN
ncbi:hypothetical protein QTA58_19295 [Neorhizobium sp. CSC1952]|uniref:hypothetical protein n=1 Tax=Neorhizobium sp. CSC1952 TaxID=2978974 RepID=UPI0025A637B2|nr:hypothetical protein [Rhizobium sp. CSC1952]WJR66344.1 hypothetical protein QTA58_19295 [Rhizobium sp. CSC1952]